MAVVFGAWGLVIGTPAFAVVSTTPTPTWQTNGRVNVIVVSPPDPVLDVGGAGADGAVDGGPGSPIAAEAPTSAAPTPIANAPTATAPAAVLRTRMLASDPTPSRPVVTGDRLNDTPLEGRAESRIPPVATIAMSPRRCEPGGCQFHPGPALRVTAAA